MVQGIKHVPYGFGIIAVPQESQHHLTVDKMNSQKNLAALFPFNRVQLDHRHIRILIHKMAKAGIIPVSPASPVYLEY